MLSVFRPFAESLRQDTFNQPPNGFSDPNDTLFDHNINTGAFDDSFGDEVSTSFNKAIKFLPILTSQDDHFGPFSDAAAVSDADPFSMSESSDEADDPVALDSFGDFGDFQSGEGHLTPTAGSWTFASDASMSSGSDDAEADDGNRNNSLMDSPKEERGMISATSKNL